MTAVAYETLPVTDLGAMMRRVEVALRDEEWKFCPVGRELWRYYSAFKWDHDSEHSRRAYKDVVGRLALRHSDWESVEEFCSPMGTEYIREFLSAEWGSGSASTRAQKTSIVKAAFKWLALERRISYDPTATIRRPKTSRRSTRQAYDPAVLHKLITSQDSGRDAAALELVCWLGLRRAELREVTVGEIDLVRGYVFVHGKGRKDVLEPLPAQWCDELNPFAMHVRHRDPREYLLYPRNRKFEPMSLAGVHNWFKRCVEKAGYPSTMTLHEMRHSAADALRRQTGDVSLAQQLLRHSSLATTDAYLHPTSTDLADALTAMQAEWGRSV